MIQNPGIPHRSPGYCVDLCWAVGLLSTKTVKTPSRSQSQTYPVIKDNAISPYANIKKKPSQSIDENEYFVRVVLGHRTKFVSAYYCGVNSQPSCHERHKTHLKTHLHSFRHLFFSTPRTSSHITVTVANLFFDHLFFLSASHISSIFIKNFSSPILIMTSLLLSLLAGLAIFSAPTPSLGQSNELCSISPPPPCLVRCSIPFHSVPFPSFRPFKKMHCLNCSAPLPIPLAFHSLLVPSF